MVDVSALYEMMTELIERQIEQGEFKELIGELVRERDVRGWVVNPENTVAVEQNSEIAADPERPLATATAIDDNSGRVEVTSAVRQSARLNRMARVDYSLSAFWSIGRKGHNRGSEWSPGGETVATSGTGSGVETVKRARRVEPEVGSGRKNERGHLRSNDLIDLGESDLEMSGYSRDDFDVEEVSKVSDSEIEFKLP